MGSEMCIRDSTKPFLVNTQHVNAVFDVLAQDSVVEGIPALVEPLHKSANWEAECANRIESCDELDRDTIAMFLTKRSCEVRFSTGVITVQLIRFGYPLRLIAPHKSSLVYQAG